MKQEIKIQIPEGTQFNSAEVDGNYLVTTFTEKKVSIDDLQSFEYCCTYLGITSELPDVSKISQKHRGYIQASYMLAIINEAWNKLDAFIPDYGNSDQLKWYPYFRYQGSAFACRYFICSRSSTRAGGGSRLCFKSEERADQFGKQFIDLHNTVLLFR